MGAADGGSRSARVTACPWRSPDQRRRLAPATG